MSTKTSIKRIAAVAAAALTIGGFSAVSAHAANPATDTHVPFALSSSTGTLVTDNYNNAGTAHYYTATVTQSAGTGNYVQLDPATDGTASSTYTFTATGNGVVSATQSAYASWVFVPATGASSTGALSGATVSASGANGNVFKAATVTGTVGTPSSAVTNLSVLEGVAGTPAAANWAPWGTGNNAFHYTGAAGDLYVALPSVSSTGWGNAYVRVSVPLAGTTTVGIAENSVTGGVQSSTTTEVFTINGFGAAAGNAYATTAVTSAANDGTGGYGTAQGYKVGSVVHAPASDKTNAAAVVTAQAVGTLGTNLTNPLLTPALTVTITGVGSLNSTVANALGSVQYTSVAAQTWTSATFPVYSDGRAGTALVTVQANGVTVGTATVVFYGKVATISATANYTILYANGTGAVTGSLATATTPHLGQAFAAPTVSDDPALAVTAKDSAGNIVPLGVSSYSVTSSSPASFSSTLTCTGSTYTSSVDDGSSALYSYGFGVGLGCFNSTAFTKSGDKGTLTLSYTNSDGTVVTATPISLTAGGKPNVATLVPDTTSYAPGQKGYFTLTATDASGNPTADDQTWSNFFTATPKVTGAFAFSTTAITQAQATVGGTEKIYFYAPIGDGTWSVTGTSGSDFVAAGQGATITASVAVGSAQTAASQAAVDAANEATDAANAATDAANNAMDSADAAQQAALDAGDKADAALAAVTDLASKVSTIASQIASLSALVKKIAKKVKA